VRCCVCGRGRGRETERETEREKQWLCGRPRNICNGSLTARFSFLFSLFGCEWPVLTSDAAHPDIAAYIIDIHCPLFTFVYTSPSLSSLFQHIRRVCVRVHPPSPSPSSSVSSKYYANCLLSIVDCHLLLFCACAALCSMLCSLSAASLNPRGPRLIVSVKVRVSVTPLLCALLLFPLIPFLMPSLFRVSFSMCSFAIVSH